MVIQINALEVETHLKLIQTCPTTDAVVLSIFPIFKLDPEM